MEINLISIVVGILLICYGLYTIYARKNTPEKFWKLEPMKKFWGQKTGVIIHIIGYSIIPIIFGIMIIVTGLKGLSVSEFLN